MSGFLFYSIPNKEVNPPRRTMVLVFQLGVPKNRDDNPVVAIFFKSRFAMSGFFVLPHSEQSS
jgi:hypothetical protein